MPVPRCSGNNTLSLQWRFVPLAALPIVVFMFGDSFITLLGNSRLEAPDSTYITKPHLEPAGRYTFFAAYLIYAGIALSILYLFLQDCVENFNRKILIRASISYLSILLTVVLFVILGPEVLGSDRTYFLIGRAQFEQSLSTGFLPTCVSGALDRLNCGENPLLNMFLTMLDFINVLTGLAVASVISGAILALAHATEINDASGDSDEFQSALIMKMQTLNSGFQRLRMYVYLAALLLAFGVVLISTWMSWPQFVLSDTNAADHRALVNATTLYFGANYSLIILSYTLPVWTILSGRSDKLAIQAAERGQMPLTPAALHEWKTNHGFTFSTPDGIKTAFAVLSPLLTGSLGTIASFLEAN